MHRETVHLEEKIWRSQHHALATCSNRHNKGSTVVIVINVNYNITILITHTHSSARATRALCTSVCEILVSACPTRELAEQIFLLIVVRRGDATGLAQQQQIGRKRAPLTQRAERLQRNDVDALQLLDQQRAALVRKAGLQVDECRPRRRVSRDIWVIHAGEVVRARLARPNFIWTRSSSS